MAIKRFLRNKDIGELRAERPHQARIGTGVSVCGGRKGQQVGERVSDSGEVR